MDIKSIILIATYVVGPTPADCHCIQLPHEESNSASQVVRAPSHIVTPWSYPRGQEYLAEWTYPMPGPRKLLQ
jgi:hypothetical protein